jgi:hypothetical protein
MRGNRCLDDTNRGMKWKPNDLKYQRGFVSWVGPWYLHMYTFIYFWIYLHMYISFFMLVAGHNTAGHHIVEAFSIFLIDTKYNARMRCMRLEWPMLMKQCIKFHLQCRLTLIIRSVCERVHVRKCSTVWEQCALMSKLNNTRLRNQHAWSICTL